MRESEQPEQMAPTDAGKSNRKRYTIIQMGKQIEKKKKNEILYLKDEIGDHKYNQVIETKMRMRIELKSK